MRLKDSPEEAAWRETVRSFIGTELPAQLRTAGFGRGAAPVQEEGGEEVRSRPGVQAGGAGFQRATGAMREWREKLLTNGWIAPAWPKEYGGADLTVMQQFIMNEEFAEHRAPNVGGMGVSMVGPTLIIHGNEEQKKEHLGRILAGEVQWCQG